ncbi:MAG: hypothetical protein AAGF26_01315 [Cyanobacteria bacterium P01_G01_bin.49]
MSQEHISSSSDDQNDQLKEDELFVEIPSEPKSPFDEKIPSGYDPMGEIYLRGRAFRGLAGGRIPWWILISGWIIFGGFALLIVMAAVTSNNFLGLIMLFIPAIILIILWRGTQAKLYRKKYRRK